MMRKLIVTTDLEGAFAQLYQQGFHRRQAQVDMANQVVQSIQKQQIAIIEGGTGVGKSFGYLLPAILALPPGKILVIATATVSLQQQLLDKDIPLLKRVLPQQISIEMAKGRRRYVCLSRLYDLGTQGSSQGELALFGVVTKLKSTDQSQIKTLLRQYEQEQWQGDRDELEMAVDDDLWLKMTTDASGCSNRKCQFFRECAYFKAKKRLQKARVIITNQDLLLSDIAFGTGVLLPKAEDCIYVIDEAHHFPDKAINHFAIHSQLLSHQSWLERVVRSVTQIQSPLKLTEQKLSQLVTEIKDVKQRLQDVHALVAGQFNSQQSSWIVFDVPPQLDDLAQSLSKAASLLYQRLAGFYQTLTEQHDTRTITDYDRFVAALGLYSQRAEQIWRTFNLFCQQTAIDNPPVARWFVPVSSKYQQDFQCHVALTSAEQCLDGSFWQQISGTVILCSATLRSLGQFDSYIRRVGLTNDKRVVTQAYASPFPYQDSGLHIAKMHVKPEGADQSRFQQAVEKILPTLLATEDKGTLVLFTNRLMMEQAYTELPNNLKSIVLMQNAYPKQRILTMHRNSIDQGQKSIIFGLQSFAEGIDLPGDYCRHLIITKLPFSVPNTPIAQVYQRWLTGRGENAFYQYSLPHASLRLTQFVGRLIRQESDVGKVTILDRRLIDKSYGKQLLANLPPFKIVDEALTA